MESVQSSPQTHKRTSASNPAQPPKIMQQCMEKLHIGHRRGGGDEGKRSNSISHSHNMNITQILDGSAQQEHYTTKPKHHTYEVSSSDQFLRQKLSPQTSYKAARTEKLTPQIKQKKLNSVHELREPFMKAPQTVQEPPYSTQSTLHLINKPSYAVEKPAKPIHFTPYPRQRQEHMPMEETTQPAYKLSYSTEKSYVQKSLKSSQVKKHPKQKQSHQTEKVIQPFQMQTPPQPTQHQTRQAKKQALHQSVENANHKQNPIESVLYLIGPNQRVIPTEPREFTESYESKQHLRNPPHYTQKKPKKMQKSQKPYDRQLQKPRTASLLHKQQEMSPSLTREHTALSEHIKQFTDQVVKEEPVQYTLGPVQRQLNSPQHAIKPAQPKHQTTMPVQPIEHSLEPHYPKQDTSKKAHRIQYEQKPNQDVSLSANLTQTTPKQPTKAQLAQMSKPEKFIQCRPPFSRFTEKESYLQQNLSELTETPVKTKSKPLQATQKSGEELHKPPHLHSDIITRSSSDEHKKQTKHPQQLQNQNKGKCPENDKVTVKINQQRELCRSHKPQNTLWTQHSTLPQHSMVQQSVYMVNLQETEHIQEHHSTSPYSAIHLTDYIQATPNTSDRSDTSDEEQMISTKETLIQPTHTTDCKVMQPEQETATTPLHKVTKSKTRRRKRSHKRKTEPTKETKAAKESTQPYKTASLCTYPHNSEDATESRTKEKKKEISKAEGKGTQVISKRTANQTNKIMKTNKKSHDHKEKISTTPMDIPRSMEGKPQTRELLQTVKTSKPTPANDGGKRQHNVKTASPLHKTKQTKTLTKVTSKTSDEQTETPIFKEKLLKTVTGPQPNPVSPSKEPHVIEKNLQRTKNTQISIKSATFYERPTKATCSPPTNRKKDFKSEIKTENVVSTHQNKTKTGEREVPEQPPKILSKMPAGKEIYPGKTRNVSLTTEKEENLCHTISDLVKPYMTLPKHKVLSTLRSGKAPRQLEKTTKFPDTLEKHSKTENLSERDRSRSPEMRKTETLAQHQAQSPNIKGGIRLAPWNMTPWAGLNQSSSSLHTPVSSLESGIHHKQKKSQTNTSKNKDQVSTFSGQSDYLRNLNEGDKRVRPSSTLYPQSCTVHDTNTSGDKDQGLHVSMYSKSHHVSSLYSKSHQKYGKDYIIDISWFNMYIYFSQRQKLELMFKRYETKKHQLMKQTDKLAHTVNVPVNSDNLISRVKKLIQLKETQKNLLEAVEGEERENNQHLEALTKELENVKEERRRLISDREMMQREINLTRKETFNLDARRCYQGFVPTQRQVHKGEYLHRYKNNLRLKVCKVDEAIKSKLKTLQSLQENYDDATMKKKELNKMTKRVSEKVKVVKKKIHKLQCLHNNINTVRQKEHSVKRFKELANNLQLQADKLKRLINVLQTVPVESHSHIPSLINALTDEEKRLISWSVTNQSLHQEPREERQDASGKYPLVASDVWTVSTSVPKHKPWKTSTEPWTVEPLDAVQRYVAIRVKGQDLWTVTDSRKDTGSG